MTLNEYQDAAMKTALPTAQNQEYMLLGLVSESGELAGKRKKRIRDGQGPGWEYTEADELGDVLWYAAGYAKMLGFTLEEIAQRNVKKLASRQERGVIGGSGDQR